MYGKRLMHQNTYYLLYKKSMDWPELNCYLKCPKGPTSDLRTSDFYVGVLYNYLNTMNKVNQSYE